MRKFVVGITSISGFNNKINPGNTGTHPCVITLPAESCNILLQKNCNKEKYLGQVHAKDGPVSNRCVSI